MEWVKLGIQVLGYIVTWGIVFAGWRVNNGQNKQRDERKERRDQIGDITDAIREVESNVVAYLTDSETANASSYWTVYFGVRQVNSSVVLCSLLATQEIDKLLRSYRKAVTDEAMPGPQAAKPTGHKLDAALRVVASSGNSLIRGLESRYRELYPFSKFAS
jgi:CHASE3 domain sensor protein